MSLRGCFILLSLLCSQAIYADQLIVEPEMGRSPVLHLLANAKNSIHLVMYGYTDPHLLNAFLTSPARQKEVLIEAHPYKQEDENKHAIQEFRSHQIRYKKNIRGVKLIHQKTLITDQQALVMSFNFTRSSFNKERNFGLLIDNPRQVTHIDHLFLHDWRGSPYLHHDRSLVLSPLNSREGLKRWIKKSKHSILIYTPMISDQSIAKILATMAQQGVNVKILLSIKPQKKINTLLRKAGVQIHKSKTYFIHAKVIISDGKTALLGSINLTTASINQNRELSVISTDPKVVLSLYAIFQKDWRH